MSQERNMADLRTLIGIKTGKDARGALEVLSEVFYARRPPSEVLVFTEFSFDDETYQLPGYPGYYLRLTVDGAPAPKESFFKLDPPLDVLESGVWYSYAQVLAECELGG